MAPIPELIYLIRPLLGVVVSSQPETATTDAGLLAVGVAIGPNALALARTRPAGMRYLAEFGVVFLMFVIGLDFSLPSSAACASTWYSASGSSPR